MKFKGIAILIAVIVLALSVSMAVADGPTPLEPLTQPPSAETGEMVNETPNAWFVEFKTLPTINGGKLKDTKADKSKFYAAAKAAGIELTERYAFDTLWNGISIVLDPADVNKLASLPGVKAIYPVLQVQIPETFSIGSPELYTAIQMTGADLAHDDGFTGEGIRVAVMDTGIDYDHPDLGGCFGEGCRVAFGYDLVGDAYNADDTAASYNPVPSPDPYPGKEVPRLLLHSPNARRRLSHLWIVH